MKTRIKTLPPIIALALLAALATTWLSSIGPAWAESPISVLSPLLPPRPAAPYDSGNYACWQRCIGEYPNRVEGFCLCKCGIENNGTCSIEDVFVAVDASPTPAPDQSGCPGWWEELDPWMGTYVLRTNGTDYCIGPRLD